MQDDRLTVRQLQQLSLSALLDGDSSQAEPAVRAWRADPAARADWHAYHLIGEVMRSDEVRCSVQHDVAFLARVRESLVAEPVVLAPAAVQMAPVGRRPWRAAWAAPMAVAAGFVAVAGVLVVTRVASPGGAAQDPASALASSIAAPVAAGLQAVAGGTLVRSPPTASRPLADNVGASALIRDAELDRYLAAHRQYSSTSAVAVPGGMARNVTVIAPAR